MKKTKDTNKGITLIALVITIIVMLILVTVTITMAVNGGLFEQASRAGTETNEAIKAEQQLARGRLKVGNTWYDSIDDYIAKKPSANQAGETTGGEEQTLKITGDTEVDVKSSITLVGRLNGETVTASSIQWTSSNPEVATVENGVVTGVNSTKGKTTITAKYDNTLTDTVEITVKPKYIGVCTKCTNGEISGYKCPECNLIGSVCTSGYYMCTSCTSISLNWEYEMSCSCGGEILPGPGVYMTACGHVLFEDDWDGDDTRLDIYRVDGLDCLSCDNGRLYDDGN